MQSENEVSVNTLSLYFGESDWVYRGRGEALGENVPPIPDEVLGSRDMKSGL